MPHRSIIRKRLINKDILALILDLFFGFPIKIKKTVKVLPQKHNIWYMAYRFSATRSVCTDFAAKSGQTVSRKLQK